MAVSLMQTQHSTLSMCARSAQCAIILCAVQQNLSRHPSKGADNTPPRTAESHAESHVSGEDGDGTEQVKSRASLEIHVARQ
jgi:hypothetical protein